jgi:hypothetical protein
MALWNDGSSPTIADLQKYESDILQVATVEEIDLSRKLEIARGIISSDLRDFLRRQTGVEGSALEDVVVTEPLHRWVVMMTLQLTYRDAHYRQLAERYKGKWTEYSEQARQARRDCYEYGVGRVRRPLGRPSAPKLLVSSGGGTAAGTYYFRVSRVGTGGVESEASEAAAVRLDTAANLEVQFSDENQAGEGWHVYGGGFEDQLSRQSTAPLAFASKWAVLAMQSGKKPSDGQAPDLYIRQRNLLWRG